MSIGKLHVVKNDSMPKWRAWLIRFAALVLALLFCGLFIYVVGGLSLGEAFYYMWKGTFGDPTNVLSMKIKLWDTGIYAAKLLCIAAALAPAFKMKFWNIGAEGQVVIGGMATALVMRNLAGYVPNAVLYILMFVFALAAGGLWGVIPAVCKAKWGTNETLFTLMMNYVAIQIMAYFFNLWRGAASSLDVINRDTKIGYLPTIFGNGYTLNIIVFVLIAILMFFYMRKTKQGYEIAVVGESPNTARYAGINVKKVIIRTMIISGAICGLVGGMTVAGQTHNIALESIAGGYGFTAIIVCWLAKFNTLAMIPISLLILFLEKGTAQLGNTYTAFATGAGDVMIGLVLFFIIASEFFINYKIMINREKEAA